MGTLPPPSPSARYGCHLTLVPLPGMRRWTWSRCTLSVDTGGGTQASLVGGAGGSGDTPRVPCHLVPVPAGAQCSLLPWALTAPCAAAPAWTPASAAGTCLTSTWTPMTATVGVLSPSRWGWGGRHRDRDDVGDICMVSPLLAVTSPQCSPLAVVPPFRLQCHPSRLPHHHPSHPVPPSPCPEVTLPGVHRPRRAQWCPGGPWGRCLGPGLQRHWRPPGLLLRRWHCPYLGPAARGRRLPQHLRCPER